jgi:hypothetical protein
MWSGVLPLVGSGGGVRAARVRGDVLLSRLTQLARTREISVWRPWSAGGRRKCPGPVSSVGKTTGDPRIGSPVREKRYLRRFSFFSSSLYFGRSFRFR